MYCKQCTQPNLTRPSLDVFRPLGLLSRVCPVPRTNPSTKPPEPTLQPNPPNQPFNQTPSNQTQTRTKPNQMKGLVRGTGQALLRSPRGRNASKDGLVKLGWVHCLQYTLNCFQFNVCGLCRCEPSNQM